MFNQKFSLESAYSTGAKTVFNHFMFFFVSIVAGILAGAIYLAALGIVDIASLHYHVAALTKMFGHAFSMPTGSLHYAGTTVHESLRSYLSADVASQVLGRDVISIDVSGSELAHILSWLVPTALLFKMFLDMMAIGWTKLALDLNSKNTVSLRYLYEFYYLVPRVFVVNLIVGLVTMAGLMVFLVPGLFVYERLRFSKYFIIDKNLSIVKSLQASWALTEGSVLHLVGFTLISVIIGSLGHLLILAILFTAPLQNQTEANVYRQLTK